MATDTSLYCFAQSKTSETNDKEMNEEPSPSWFNCWLPIKHNAQIGPLPPYTTTSVFSLASRINLINVIAFIGHFFINNAIKNITLMVHCDEVLFDKEKMKVCIAVDNSEISQNALDCELLFFKLVVSTHLDYHRVLHRNDNELIICHVAVTYQKDQDNNLTKPDDFSRALTMQMTASRNLEDKYRRLLSRYPGLVRTWLVCNCCIISSDQLFSVKIQENAINTGASIVSLAHREGCGLVIMGNRQMAAEMADSVSDYVVNHSWIPVLVCPAE